MNTTNKPQPRKRTAYRARGRRLVIADLCDADKRTTVEFIRLSGDVHTAAELQQWYEQESQQ